MNKIADQNQIQRLVEIAMRSSLKYVTPLSGVRSGSQKSFYIAATTDKRMFLGVVSATSSYPLCEEHQRLIFLHSQIPSYFPEPYFYEANDQYQILGMEFLSHVPLTRLVNTLSRRQERQIAYHVGFALGSVYSQTGFYTTAPTDDNV